jgi:hypothetical protein
MYCWVYETKIRCAGERGAGERQRSDVLLANRGREADVLLANGVYGTKIRCAGERGVGERQRSDVLLANRGREADVLLVNGGREQRREVVRLIAGCEKGVRYLDREDSM